ncbi:MAG: DUF4013 domain-containing protein [Anaerolineaceae bacterium]|nr:DUF4013 domain-containing protein [Anaerolineaceae bacterium]
MDFALAFSYPFKDPDWAKKILIAGLITIIPIIGWIFLLGWGVEITRRVIRSEQTLLPDIDFGTHLAQGFQVFIIELVYAIPLIIFTLPPNLIPVIVQNMQDSNYATTLTAVIGLCCGGLSLIYGLFLGFVLPAAIGNFAAKGTIGAGFSFGEIFALIRTAPVAYLIVFLASILASIIAQLGIIACVVGFFFTSAYAVVVMGHFYGQAYREGTSTPIQAQTPMTY